MEVEQRFSRIQLFVKAAEQYTRLKAKQTTRDSGAGGSSGKRGPRGLRKWTKSAKNGTRLLADDERSIEKQVDKQREERESLGNRDLVQDMTLLQVLAFNALELTAPASDILLRNRRTSWVQLSGHPGSFAPAGPGTLWKKHPGTDNNERVVYEALKNDVASDIVPKYYREVTYQGESFIEMQDLLYKFTDPNVMDIKMGTRTFLESEVTNTAARTDLYLKMVKVDPSAPTEEEHALQAVTKLRYMMFREQQSSTCSLGFRIEAIKFQGSPPVTDLKTTRTRDEVRLTLAEFLSRQADARHKLLRRLKYMREKFEASPYFGAHEVVGSSILIVYDNNNVGAWIIDFVKTLDLPEGVSVTHRRPWVLGNHEEGYLTGLDNLIQVNVPKFISTSDIVEDLDLPVKHLA